MDASDDRPSVGLVIYGPIEPGDIPGLCRRARRVFTGLSSISCDVSSVGRPDATAVDALAHLHLTAGRCGCEVVFIDASDELRDLIALAGLSDVVRT